MLPHDLCKVALCKVAIVIASTRPFVICHCERSVAISQKPLYLDPDAGAP